MRYLTRSLVNRIRWTDEIGRFDNKHIGAVLPDTPAVGAWRVADNVSGVIAAKTSAPKHTVYTYPSTYFFNGNGHSSELNLQKGGVSMG